MAKKKVKKKAKKKAVKKKAVKKKAVKKKKVAKKTAKKTVKKAAKVVIYTTPTCPYCRFAKQFFDKHGVKYLEKDVSTDHKLAEEMIDKSGQMGVPVIIIGNTIIVGYDEQALRQALKLK